MNEELPPEAQNRIVVFGAKRIRRIWHGEQWFFSVVDIIGALTDSDNPRNYWNMMKAREQKQSDVQLSTLCVQRKLTSADGKRGIKEQKDFAILTARESLPARTTSRTSPGPHCQASRTMNREISHTAATTHG